MMQTFFGNNRFSEDHNCVEFDDGLLPGQCELAVV
jgi:hypothetical protein